MGVHLRECGDIRCGLVAPVTHAPREPVMHAGLHCAKLKKQFARCDGSLWHLCDVEIYSWKSLFSSIELTF